MILIDFVGPHFSSDNPKFHVNFPSGSAKWLGGQGMSVS
jgi:hypothetical protein